MVNDTDASSISIPDLCKVIAGLTDLDEGPEGVEHILRLVYENQPASPRDIAKEIGLPVPLVSAVRREFEKMGWMLRQGGMVLSDEATAQAKILWGRVDNRTKTETSSHESDQRGFLNRILKTRPEADRALDQSHATRKTMAKRAEHFIQEGLIQGKRVLFLGDDDLTSLATLHLLREKRGFSALESCQVTVLELDDRLVDLMRSVAEKEGFPLAVEKVDLREELPANLIGGFDFFFTDPPYTPQGAGLFLDRGCQALRLQSGTKAALAIPLSPPSLQIATQKIIQEKGFVIDYLYPGFNHYMGATMQGGISALYGLTLRVPGSFDGESHNGPLYTREAR